MLVVYYYSLDNNLGIFFHFSWEYISIPVSFSPPDMACPSSSRSKKSSFGIDYEQAWLRPRSPQLRGHEKKMKKGTLLLWFYLPVKVAQDQTSFRVEQRVFSHPLVYWHG